MLGLSIVKAPIESGQSYCYKLDDNLCCERKTRIPCGPSMMSQWKPPEIHRDGFPVKWAFKRQVQPKRTSYFWVLNFFLYTGLDIPDNLETISAVTSLMGHTVGKFIYSKKPTKIRQNLYADSSFSNKLINWEISWPSYSIWTWPTFK